MILSIDSDVWDMWYNPKYFGHAKAICKDCGSFLISKYSHNFVACKCKDYIFVDGGNDLLRRFGGEPSKFDPRVFDAK